METSTGELLIVSNIVRNGSLWSNIGLRKKLFSIHSSFALQSSNFFFSHNSFMKLLSKQIFSPIDPLQYAQRTHMCLSWVSFWVSQSYTNIHKRELTPKIMRTSVLCKKSKAPQGCIMCNATGTLRTHTRFYAQRTAIVQWSASILRVWRRMQWVYSIVFLWSSFF